MNQTHQSTFTYYVHLSFYFLFNMIIVLYNALLNIFAWKRRLTNFLLLSLIIIIIIIIIFNNNTLLNSSQIEN